MTIKMIFTECPDEIECSISSHDNYGNPTYKLSFSFPSYEGDYVDKEVSFEIAHWQIKEFKQQLQNAIKILGE